MADNVNTLVRKWIHYATNQGIKVSTKRGGEQQVISDGRPPEDKDLAEFLKREGFSESVIQTLIDELPAVADDKATQTVKTSDGEYEDDVDFDDPNNSRNLPDEAGDEEEVEIDPEDEVGGGLSMPSRAEPDAPMDQDRRPENRPQASQSGQRRRDQYDYSVDGVTRGELNDIAKQLDPEEQLSQTKKRYLKNIMNLVGMLSKDERKYLKKELRNGRS